jgi:hypothetical protein
VALCFGDFVVPMFLPADAYFRLRQSCFGIDINAANVSGTDAEAMSGSLRFSGLEGSIYLLHSESTSHEPATVSFRVHTNGSAPLTVASAQMHIYGKGLRRCPRYFSRI